MPIFSTTAFSCKLFTGLFLHGQHSTCGRSSIRGGLSGRACLSICLTRDLRRVFSGAGCHLRVIFRLILLGIAGNIIKVKIVASC
jgi:hypothetical protein